MKPLVCCPEQAHTYSHTLVFIYGHARLAKTLPYNNTHCYTHLHAQAQLQLPTHAHTHLDSFTPDYLRPQASCLAAVKFLASPVLMCYRSG